jgi:Family of unknown function (DUF6069)
MAEGPREIAEELACGWIDFFLRPPNTLVQMLVGLAVLAAIVRLWPARAARIWQIVAGVVLVLSLWMLFSIPGAPLAFSIALDAMHVVAGALAMWMLPVLARERPRERR